MRDYDYDDTTFIVDVEISCPVAREDELAELENEIKTLIEDYGFEYKIKS